MTASRAESPFSGVTSIYDEMKVFNDSYYHGNDVEKEE